MDFTEQELMNAAILKYGIPSQLNMVKEELAELIVAVSKLERKGDIDLAINQCCEEVADVEIMIQQLFLILEKFRPMTTFGSRPIEERITGMREDKLKRLLKLVGA